ncbi:MAG: complexin-2 [Parasporobacterium sp.]|nr:complexin-2 [Parasporobacterium sp.]
MSKNIMIPEKIFTALYKCFVMDLENKCESCIGCTEIRRQLEMKGDRIYQHELYTKSKAATTPAERETARQKYLDERGIHPDFRFAQTAFPADDL